MTLDENLESIYIENQSGSDDLKSNSNLIEDPNEFQEGEVNRVNLKLFCAFSAGGEEYAIPMDFVKEVVKMPRTTPIPQMPMYFSNMANIRGEVYGILDLEKFFQDSSSKNDHHYLLIIKDNEYRVAIALKQIPNTLKVADSMIEELSSATLGSLKGKKYLSGIVKQEKQMIILFDVKGMIASDQFTQVTT